MSTRAGLFSLLVAPISVRANLQRIYGVYQNDSLPYGKVIDLKGFGKINVIYQ